MELKVSVSTNLIGSKDAETIIVDDDTTKSEAREIAEQWLWENIDFYWNEEDFEDDKKPNKDGNPS